MYGFNSNTLIVGILLTLCSCADHFPELSGDRNNVGLVYPSSSHKVKTLQTDGEFSLDVVSPGLTYYTFNGYDDVSQAPQMAYVIELDLNDEAYHVDFAYTVQGDSLSSVMTARNGVAGINAAYESEAVYLKADGFVISDVDLEPDHLRFWKHDGVIFGEGCKIGIAYGGSDRTGSIRFYNEMQVMNIFAGSPMLIDDDEPVGENFVPPYYTLSELETFDYEDYRRHQGVRHPRTAVALTDDNDLLLIVVDGRKV